MRRVVSIVLVIVVFLGLTAAAAAVSINRVSGFAEAENREKTALVQNRLDETLELLIGLSEDAFIRSPAVSYLDKAQFLTDMNRNQALGYMMVRILDGEINIYREGVGATSNLASREYMQKLYSTGEPQVTDAFLAGADGTTINYTVTAAIKEDGEVVSALMAAIYGTEIDALLQSEGAKNALVGSLLQYMGGVPNEQFGLSVAQLLESELETSRPVENILTDFQDERGGSFWGLGSGVHYFVYAPIEHADWIVMTEVEALPMVHDVIYIYIGCVAALILAACLLLRKRKPKAE